MSNNKETFQRGDFQFEKGTGNVIFVPNENGAWNVQVMPEKPAPEGKGDGWEIVEYWNADGFHSPTQKCKSNGCKIHSVKRLSDGEVFSVGDFIKVIETGRKGWSDAITDFLIIGGDMIAQFETWRQPINHLERMHKEIKVTEARAPKQHLFTTTDGKPVYEWDERLWRVFTTPHNYEMWKPFNLVRTTAPMNGEFCFSSEAAAKEYILLNKPVLSVNDIKEAGELSRGMGPKMVLISFEKLEAAAKSKIDKP